MGRSRYSSESDHTAHVSNAPHESLEKSQIRRSRRIYCAPDKNKIRGRVKDRSQKELRAKTVPSANHNLEFGMHSITSAPHRPRQNENITNSGGSIEICDAIALRERRAGRYSHQCRRQNKCIPNRRTLHAGDNSDLPEKPPRAHTQRASHDCTSALKKNKTVDTTTKSPPGLNDLELI